MICRRYQKLTQYLHVSDGANEPAWNNVDYDKLYKIHPMLNMVQDKIKQLMKAWLLLKADLVMYIIYLPNWSREELKYGCTLMLIQHICINLRCILVNRKTQFDLGYDVVMKLCKDISEKYHHVYCDNLFTSVHLLKDCLACITYCNGTIQVNKKYHTEDICKPGRMICGAYKSCQDGSSCLMAHVWQDNGTVRLVSTNSNPKKCCSEIQEIGS